MRETFSRIALAIALTRRATVATLFARLAFIPGAAFKPFFATCSIIFLLAAGFGAVFEAFALTTFGTEAITPSPAAAALIAVAVAIMTALTLARLSLSLLLISLGARFSFVIALRSFAAYLVVALVFTAF